VSNPDSFIDEVSEEVRRDRLFGYLRRYGWIGLVLVLLIVGGAAAWEWRRSQIEAQAQARGDALRAALAEPDAAARVAALEPVAQAEPGAPVAALALAAEQQAAGESAAAVATLDALAGHGETPEIYRDIAALKSLLIDSERTAEDRLMALDAPIDEDLRMVLLRAMKPEGRTVESLLPHSQSLKPIIQGVLADIG